MNSRKQNMTNVEPLPMLAIAPSQLIRGHGTLSQLSKHVRMWGNKAMVLTGEASRAVFESQLNETELELGEMQLNYPLFKGCTEVSLSILRQSISVFQPDVIIGVGGGKVLDTAKLIADRSELPVFTIPTSAATCAAWTALSNVYSLDGSFEYDVSLSQCPHLMLVDYNLIATAPQRTLVAGIGDAIAKWYEASVSSGTSDRTMVIAAVQQAKVLRDILFQKSQAALQNPQGSVWQEVVDATVCLAGVIGGVGGANCRTVAAHAIHNGLTHLPQAKVALHGEKVAYGILVQLRLEEFQGSEVAATARQELLEFYSRIGLPKTLVELGLQDVTAAELQAVATASCQPNSDIHRLPFQVTPELVLAAMTSTINPV
jgi:glycerol dehydrogenase-like iron-containing ADH family enzyme